MKKTLAKVPRIALGTTAFLVLLAAVSTSETPDALAPGASVQDPQVTATATTTVTIQDPKAKAPDETVKQDPDKVTFLETAFPPTVPDTDWHRGAWWTDDCMRCHETGVADAPKLVHQGMPDVLLTAKCRSCHVLIPGSKPRKREAAKSRFEPNAFPPMIPASARHRDAWLVNNCLLCHDESRIGGAPMVKHEGMPKVLLQAKCRSCHVQVRTIDVMKPGVVR